jgi:hypothetical protein
VISIYDKDGIEIDLSDYGLTCYSFTPESLTGQFDSESIGDWDGEILLGTTIKTRKLFAEFHFEADVNFNYQASRDKIYELFNPKNGLYIIDNRLPNKRWSVRNATVFKPERINATVGRFNVDFLVFGVYAESAETTLNQEIVNLSGNKVQKYTHTTAIFEILNDGYKTIDPRRYPLLIKFIGESTNLQIKNLTTGDVWAYTGTTTPSDTIRLDGIRSTKNSLSIFRDTNRKLITLSPGWNEFELTGAVDPFEISFDFRFYTI